MLLGWTRYVRIHRPTRIMGVSIICPIPPSLGMLSSDPLGMPDAEGVGRAVPPSGGVSLLPPNAWSGDDWPREGDVGGGSRGGYSSVNSGL